MDQKKFGSTGVSVSSVCLGTMQFGGTTDEQTSCDILDYFTDQGGTFLDTANIYSYGRPNCVGGESEELLGRWFRNRKNRSQVFIATKVGMVYPDSEKGLKAGQIVQECEKSLRRLGIETIDLYYAHADDRCTPLEESLEAFDGLTKSGKVRYIGASNYQTWRLAKALGISRCNGWAEYCCIQQRYAYLRPRPDASFEPQVAASAELLDMSITTGFPIIGYAPLLKGVLAGRQDKKLWPQYDWQDSHLRIEALQAVAKEAGVTQAQVALAWMISGTANIFPLVAAGTVEQLKENLSGTALQLSSTHLERLEAAGV